jgi:hypothetical protein
MKIIISRKGFDIGSGGVPSPIFPDGKLISLPIPDIRSTIKYEDIKWGEYNLGDIVSGLTKEKIKANFSAHLDPDLRPESLPRSKGWKPLFGQTGSARGHLKKCGIQTGDVFLFFGLFREVVPKECKLDWRPHAQNLHVIWGWFQIGQIISLDLEQVVPEWAEYHPHLQRPPERNNTLYVSTPNVRLPITNSENPRGAGVFTYFSPTLQLTAPDSVGPSTWQLPGWFFPREGKVPLTYHKSSDRWKREGDFVRLNTVARGQEFVIDCTDYPESVEWLQSILAIGDGSYQPSKSLTIGSGGRP